MFNITNDIYDDVSQRLIEKIEDKYYFSGTIAFSTGEISYRLTIAVIIYRDANDTITDMVSVWDEFHTYDSSGETVNNYLFSELKKYLIK